MNQYTQGVVDVKRNQSKKVLRFAATTINRYNYI